MKCFDWYRDRAYVEELVVEEGAIRLDRLRRGAPLLNTHSQWSLEAQLGVVENPLIQNGQGTCSATFSRRESVAGDVQDVADGIICNVSVGYVRHRIEMVAPAAEVEPSMDIWLRLKLTALSTHCFTATCLVCLRDAAR
ncbi:MAG: hypothetical protein JZU58_25285 [Curvibacter lanceolatus]|uniref:hypothetical protein n=1 Tax=Curvibacter lanceolatus TaxID=86182 RepID=UPI0023565C16|nr:hypothetical protein [Curvibacter lanceolatus]MBV5295664.1 hypothetical protein [Curvibacter lanceolatus]